MAPLIPVPACWLPSLADEAVARVSGEHIVVGEHRLAYCVDGLRKA